MSEQKAKVHGLVPLNEEVDQLLHTKMHQTSIITDQPQPEGYSNWQYFTKEEWDEFPFASKEDIRWWMDAKFGLFIHWNPCSLIGAEIGWSRGGGRGPEKSGDQVPVEIYDHLYHWFNPQRFHAEEWVEMAKRAGQKYIVLIAKHHDGFCLWDTKTTDYNSMNTPFGRDIVKELSEACNDANMPFGVYFSQRDWYQQAYFTETHWKYAAYMTEQVRELMSYYGKISILWLDAWYPSLFKPEHWNAKEIHTMVRTLQPGILINNRCSLPGDYDTPEGVIGSYQVNRPWETTTSLHNGWSWNPNTFRTTKSFKKCIDILVGCAIGGGNLILNIGPRADGSFEPEHQQRLYEVGDWLRQYEKSIYNTRGGPAPSGTWGGFTWKENKMYIHILYASELEKAMDCYQVKLPELPNHVLTYECLTGSMVQYKEESNCIMVPYDTIDTNDTIIQITYDTPIICEEADPRNGTRI